MKQTNQQITRSWIQNQLNNKWFSLSVAVTITLLVVLIGNLVYSARTNRVFREESLAMERASGELMRHTQHMEMASHMAAATGNLVWEKTYTHHEEELNNLLKTLPSLIESEEANVYLSRLETHLTVIRDAEHQSFNLISRGYSREAQQILTGWDYTREKLEMEETLVTLVNQIHRKVEEQMALITRVNAWVASVVFVGIILLIGSWFTYIQIWRRESLERQEKEERILYLSYRDPLTGIYNRRYFEEEVERMNVPRRMPLAIILGDADELKRINDTLGHKVGDQLLTEMARILKESVRKEDVVARWGGDEFGIILPNSDEHIAMRIVEQIEEACRQSDFQATTPHISLGYAIKHDPAESVDRIFTRAENRMYKKKRLHKKQIRQREKDAIT